MSSEIKPGSVVYSTQGRDKDNFYVCVAVVNQRFVLVADGKLHKLAKPKRKNVRHLKSTGQMLDVIAGKFEENKKVFDSELNSSLRNACCERR